MEATGGPPFFCLEVAKSTCGVDTSDDDNMSNDCNVFFPSMSRPSGKVNTGGFNVDVILLLIPLLPSIPTKEECNVFL